MKSVIIMFYKPITTLILFNMFYKPLSDVEAPITNNLTPKGQFNPEWVFSNLGHVPLKFRVSFYCMILKFCILICFHVIFQTKKISPKTSLQLVSYEVF